MAEVDGASVGSSSKKKRRAKKLKAPLEDPFLRRSKRINKNMQEFTDQVSAAALASGFL